MAWFDAPITQGFGPTDERLDGPYGGYAHFNKGRDFGIPVGTPIESIVGGEVIRVVRDPNDASGWGVHVWVRDAMGNTHNFGHLDSADVEEGDTVQPGTVIGRSGNTGKSTGPHLSYDVWDENGRFFDYLADESVLPEGLSFGMSAQSGGSEDERVQAFLDELYTKMPRLADFEDDPDLGISAYEQYQEAMFNWFKLASSAREYVQADALNEQDRLQQDFANRMAEYDRDLSYDDRNLDRFGKELDRWATGMAESRARAQAIQDEDQLLREWGTAPGKTSFTQNDLGLGWMSDIGNVKNDPNQTILNFPGTRDIDVRKSFADFDALYGVGGAAPSVPSLVTQPGNRPRSPNLPRVSSPVSRSVGGGGPLTSPPPSYATGQVQPTYMGSGLAPDQFHGGAAVGGGFSAPPVDIGASLVPPAGYTTPSGPSPTWWDMIYGSRNAQGEPTLFGDPDLFGIKFKDMRFWR